MTGLDELLARARAWRDQDPDADTRAELDALIADAENGDDAELAARFDGRLAFGTAGLRGELGAGPRRMNRVLVAQAAGGLAAHLLAAPPTGSASGEAPSVVIGYDGRTNSDVFARDTAEIMAGAGIRTILLPRRLPTPVLAFAVRHLDASAGVMVTASHNPAADNGYKVYLGGHDGGSQIVAPADAAIAERIAVVATGRIDALPRSTAYGTAGEELVDAYVAATARVGRTSAPSPRFVYTAMHGVGWETARRVFAEAGFDEPIVVTEQIEPDPAFPTVAFPNPEEPGALDLAIATAEANDADLLIANDPDADRLAAAVPTTAGWRRLSGNELGAILGWSIARELEAHDADGVFAASIVSSPALAAVARHYRFDYRDTLTGFKWISRVGGLSFGYEEALGYLVNPDTVRDKDGISAAVAFLKLFAELPGGFDAHLRAFDETFGAFASSQISIRVDDLTRIDELMSRLRAHPLADIGGIRVDQIDDFAAGFGEFPPSDILRYRLADGARVIVRPSGTEPKLKIYIDAASDSGTVEERRSAAGATMATLDRAMRALVA